MKPISHDVEIAKMAILQMLGDNRDAHSWRRILQSADHVNHVVGTNQQENIFRCTQVAMKKALPLLVADGLVEQDHGAADISMTKRGAKYYRGVSASMEAAELMDIPGERLSARTVMEVEKLLTRDLPAGSPRLTALFTALRANSERQSSR